MVSTIALIFSCAALLVSIGAFILMYKCFKTLTEAKVEENV